MKSIHNLRTVIVSLLFMMLSILSTQAAHYENLVNTDSQKKRIIKKKNIIQKIKTIFSKLSDKDKSISALSNWALVLGILSLPMALIGFFYSLTGLMLFGLIAALFGGIFSIQALRKIRDSKNYGIYKGKKTTAIVGLIFSSLTALLPIVYMVIILGLLMLQFGII